MKPLFFQAAVIIALSLGCFGAAGQSPTAVPAPVKTGIEREYPTLFELYKHLHAHPELSFEEEKTSELVASELKNAGYEVTTKVGRHGVVAVLRNGNGPTVLVRTDLDGLPVKEETGLPYASKVIAKDPQGHEAPVMHACGHDIHMTCAVGVARILAQMKDRWHGTLVIIGQPAEERGGGARAMLADGLFTRFPKPDFCLALHDDAELAAGTIGYTPGFALANVDSIDVIVHGVGGHGASPHKTKDPIVLAARIVVALQTIVSREVRPGEPAVVTVGSIHGGTKHNIIPEEVRLQLTVRSYTEEVRQQTIAAIKRIVRGEAIAADIAEDRLPEVILGDDFTPATYNDPELTERLVRVFEGCFGEANVIKRKPTMGGEDFAEYGRTEHKIPICMFVVGGVSLENFKKAKDTGVALPSLHSAYWAPDPAPTIKTGITAMIAAVLELMGTKP
jgi:hippurate hydrolase